MRSGLAGPVLGLALLLAAGPVGAEPAAAPAIRAQDLESIHQAWNEADLAVWQELNVGDAGTIARASAARRSLEARLFEALSLWSAEPVPPGPLHPAIEAMLLARRQRRDDLARRAAHRLVQLVPPSHDDYGLVQMVAGTLAKEGKEPAAAVAAFRRAAASEAFPARDAALLFQAESESTLGDTAAAARSMRSLLAVSPPSVRGDRARAWLAGLAMETQRWEEALGWLEPLLAAAPKGEDGARLSLMRARALRQLGRDLEARRGFVDLCRAYPGTRASRDGWTELSAWLRGRGEAPTAEERLAGGYALLRFGDEEPGTALLRGLSGPEIAPAIRIDAAEKEAAWLYGRKRWSDARLAWAAMETAAAGNPARRADARIGQARAWRNAGQTVEMTRAYESLAADTTQPVIAARALWEMAKEYKSLGRFADAERVLDRYIAGFPYGEEILTALQTRGLCRFITGRYRLADEDFQVYSRKVERRADKENAAFWRGRSRLAQADTAGAVEALKAGLAWDIPDNYYGFRIQELLADLGAADTSTRYRPAPRFDLGSNPFDPAGLEQVGERARTQFRRGVALARGGYAAEAQQDLNRTAEMLPDDPSIHEVNAGIGIRLGLYTFAMQSARRALGKVTARGDEARLWRYVYALGHHDLVEPAARENDLDPMLVTGLIRRESLFDERAVSRAGARGLMQLMLPTARSMARHFGDPPPDESDLFRPALSVQYGTRYLRQKVDEFGNRVEVALAAYNAGEAKAREWVGLLPAWDPDLFMEMIDYAETKDYVRLVRYNQETYHLFYDPVLKPGGADEPAR